MPLRRPTPHLDVLVQWRKEAEVEMKKYINENLQAGHPAITMAIVRAYTKGYMRGRIHQWRIEQEVSVFREALDKE